MGEERKPSYYVAARLVPLKTGARRKPEFLGMKGTGKPFVAIEAQALLLSRQDSTYKLYKLDDKLTGAVREFSGKTTPQHPESLQFTKKTKELLRQAVEDESSVWMRPPPVGLEAKTWGPTRTKR